MSSMTRGSTTTSFKFRSAGEYPKETLPASAPIRQVSTKNKKSISHFKPSKNKYETPPKTIPRRKRSNECPRDPESNCPDNGYEAPRTTPTCQLPTDHPSRSSHTPFQILCHLEPL